MPCAESPSAIAFTSSGCSLQKSAIWSNDSAVFSTSHTAVAFGISGASCIGKSPSRFARPSGRSRSSSGMTGIARNIGADGRPGNRLSPGSEPGKQRFSKRNQQPRQIFILALRRASSACSRFPPGVRERLVTALFCACELRAPVVPETASDRLPARSPAAANAPPRGSGRRLGGGGLIAGRTGATPGARSGRFHRRTRRRTGRNWRRDGSDPAARRNNCHRPRSRRGSWQGRSKRAAINFQLVFMAGPGSMPVLMPGQGDIRSS